MGLKRSAWLGLKRFVEGQNAAAIDSLMPYLMSKISSRDWKMLTSGYNDEEPLPTNAPDFLTLGNPRLSDLRREYENLNLPVTIPSAWNKKRLQAGLNLAYFRGQNPYVWQYIDWPSAMALKFYLLAQYVRDRDDNNLLSRLTEDGAFGCWTYSYPGFPKISRDLLDSVNEINFLNLHLEILTKPGVRMLDIGAGYGRLAYHMSQAASAIGDYCCVDAIPESTFLCEYYTKFRECPSAVRVTPLHRISSDLSVDGFDLAVNIHSFSECPHIAVSWWMNLLERLRVRYLLIVPNEPTELLTTEIRLPGENTPRRRSFRRLIENAGYELKICRPIIEDQATRELLGIDDHFYLFGLT